jgi:hypothetical protein
MKVPGMFVAASVLICCGREKAPASGRSAAIEATGATGSVVAWDSALGDIVATPSVETGAPVLFVRDTASTADVQVELFNHEGRSTHAIMSPLARRQSCAWARAGVLSGTAGQPSSIVWSLGLAPGSATPIAIDGISELLPRDSAALATRVHRQVSAVPDDSTSGPFRGLPIVVRDAWLFRLEDSSTVAIAVATRSLNVESNPRTEVTTIIMEHSPAREPEEWRTAFVQRSAGPEDRVEGADLLAAFRLRGNRTAVAFAREGERGLQVDIVERTAPSTWLVRWSSAALPCAR